MAVDMNWHGIASLLLPVGPPIDVEMWLTAHQNYQQVTELERIPTTRGWRGHFAIAETEGWLTETEVEPASSRLGAGLYEGRRIRIACKRADHPPSECILTAAQCDYELERRRYVHAFELVGTGPPPWPAWKETTCSPDADS